MIMMILKNKRKLEKMMMMIKTKPQKTAMKRLRKRSKYQQNPSLVSDHTFLNDQNVIITFFSVELDRLTTVVQAIENDCQICPVGSFRLTPEHQVRRNEAFKGLCNETGMDLSNYLHFRNVQDEGKRQELDLPTAPFNTRFLESASEDQPKGCWTLQMGGKMDKVMIRSLMWPGYNFYHQTNSNRFGAIYIGDGLKNLELHFIVQ